MYPYSRPQTSSLPCLKSGAYPVVWQAYDFQILLDYSELLKALTNLGEKSQAGVHRVSVLVQDRTKIGQKCARPKFMLSHPSPGNAHPILTNVTN